MAQLQRGYLLSSGLQAKLLPGVPILVRHLGDDVADHSVVGDKIDDDGAGHNFASQHVAETFGKRHGLAVGDEFFPKRADSFTVIRVDRVGPTFPLEHINVAARKFDISRVYEEDGSMIVGGDEDRNWAKLRDSGVLLHLVLVRLEFLQEAER